MGVAGTVCCARAELQGPMRSYIRVVFSSVSSAGGHLVVTGVQYAATYLLLTACGMEC